MCIVEYCENSDDNKVAKLRGLCDSREWDLIGILGNDSLPKFVKPDIREGSPLFPFPLLKFGIPNTSLIESNETLNAIRIILLFFILLNNH